MQFPIQHQYQHHHLLGQPIRQNSQGKGRFLQRNQSPFISIAKRGLGDISKTLSSVDQVIKVVRTASPIVQEYGPIVKNLPAMYKIIKAIGQVDRENVQQTNKKEVKYQEKITNNSRQQKHEIAGIAAPRLYI